MNIVSENQNKELLNQYLVTTAHELRTPLQTIISTTELLKETDLNPEQAEYIKHLDFSSNVLIALANNILDFSKISSGKFEIEKIPINIKTKIEQTTSLVTIEAHNKGIEVIVDIDEQTPTYFFGDPIRIQQVLLNLIKNAVKFTQKGYVRVRLSYRKQNNVLLFEIQDSGIGIPYDKQEKLFTAFYQTDSAITRHFGGTGLGLTISKQLVHLMGGSIGMQTSPTGGSLFWFTIPFLPCSDQMLVQEKSNLPSLKEIRANIPKNTRILIVDDQVATLHFLYKKCKYLGISHIDLADNGKNALLQLNNAVRQGKTYAFVLIDMLMEKMDGWQLAFKIHNNASLLNIPLYLMIPEGKISPEAKMHALKWFKGYLYKPIRQNTLEELVFAHFTHAVLHTNLHDVATPFTISDNAHRLETIAFDAQKLKILVVEDHIVNQTLLVTFLKQFNCIVWTATNGNEALDVIANNSEIELILMDIQMPIKNGIEASIELRANGYAGIIIACTANTDEQNLEKYLQSGFNGMLAKPFKKQIIQDTLKKWMHIIDFKTIDAPMEFLLKSGKGLDYEKFKIIWDKNDFLDTVSHNVVLAKELLDEFITITDSFLLEIPKYINEKNFEALRRIAHTIKGSSASLSIFGVTKFAEQAEQYAHEKNNALYKTAIEFLTQNYTLFKNIYQSIVSKELHND